jgi:hypothetical protein
MNKQHKTQKELEKIMIKKELALCRSIKKDIHLYEKVNEISSSKKRERRESSRSPTSSTPHSQQQQHQQQQPSSIDIHITLTKLFAIASKQNSFTKTMTLLNCLIIKVKHEQPQYKLSFLIKMFYFIMISPHKNNPLTITLQYKDLYTNAESIITNNDKEYDEGVLYDIFLSFGLMFTNEYALYQDDSFLFNATTKIIGDTLNDIDVPNANAEKCVVDMEKELLSKKCISVTDRNVVNELKRKMCVDMIKGMAMYAKLAMKGHVKLFCRSVMLNYQMKLNEDMKKMVIELINELACKGKGSGISGIVRDDKIKVMPSDNYYQVSDARDEKILVSNYDKWESKQNGIEATKQYFG